jgi:hypothetical protein
LDAHYEVIDDDYADPPVSPVAAAQPAEDFSDDDGLYSETTSPTGDVDDTELMEDDEEDGARRADSVLSWKVEHASGDHKLKGRAYSPSFCASCSLRTATNLP